MGTTIHESQLKSKKETNSSKIDEIQSPGLDSTGRAHLLAPRFSKDFIDDEEVKMNIQSLESSRRHQ